jgi:hypothetical protein
MRARVLLAAAVLAAGASAKAQVSLYQLQQAAPVLAPPAPAPPAPAPAPAQAATAAPAPANSTGGVGLEAGMSVTDPSGNVIGEIAELGHLDHGDQMAVIDVDGRQVMAPAASLTRGPAGNQAISNQTKDQLLATANRSN